MDMQHHCMAYPCLLHGMFIQIDHNNKTAVLIGSISNYLTGMALQVLGTTGSVQFAAQKMTAT